jgi:hypothetical protein
MIKNLQGERVKKSERLICTIYTFDQFWQVYFKNKAHLTTPSGDVYDGLTIYDLHEIHISDDLERQRLEEVVYHEVAHAFNGSLYGNKQTFTDEDMCDFIGRYGYHIHTQAQIILASIYEEEK